MRIRRLVPRAANPDRGCAALALATLALTALSLAALADPGRAAFTEEAQFGAGATISVAWGDCDNDGDLDVAVCRYGSPNRLFVNNGNGTFTDTAQFGTGNTFAVAWADFDNDGDLDLAVGRGTNQQNYLYINNGNGSFTASAQFGLKRTCALAWGDADNDGDLDLAVGNGILGVADQNYLFRNNGNGTFSQENQFGLGQTGAVAWADFDQDGDLDLAVGNGGFGQEGQNYLYVNNGTGVFTERAEFGLGDTASLAWGDCDNDGDLDLAVGNWGNTGCVLYLNNGDGTFAGHPEFGARQTNTVSWGDADLDGDLDLAVGNGDFSNAQENYLYLNNGNGAFVEEADFGLGSTDALAFGDADNDGDLDIAAGNEHSPAQNYLYRNGLTGASWLSVHLHGRFHLGGAGYSNRDGIGAKVAVYAAGHLGDPAFLLGFREVEAHGGFAPQNQVAAVFGLPGQPAVDLRITWPGSAGSHRVQDLTGIAVGQRLEVEESVPAAGVDPVGGELPGSARGALMHAAPNPAAGRVDLWWASGTSGSGAVEVLDVQGRLVRRLAGLSRDARTDAAGAVGLATPNLSRAIWDGRDEQGRAVPAGVYLVRAALPGAISTRVTLVR